MLYAATRQLISGAEWGTPHLVVAYVDRLLSIFDAQPFALRVRAADLRDQYSDGIALLDELAERRFHRPGRDCAKTSFCPTLG